MLANTFRGARATRSALAAAVAAVALASGAAVTTAPVVATTPPPPALTAFTPNSGPASGGNEVTFTGYLNGSTPVVKFGDQVADVVPGSVNSGGLKVYAPPGTSGTAVDVTATFSFGAVNRPGRYTYATDDRAPVTATPAYGKPSGGNTVTISSDGSIDFRTITAVKFGTQTATLGPATATSIEVTAPAGTPGTKPGITVVTADGTVQGQAADRYTYAWSENAPAITRLELPQVYPNGGIRNTIYGSSLRGALEVTVDGEPIEFIESRNDATLPIDGAELTFITKAHAVGTVDVRVRTAAGLSANTPADDLSFVDVVSAPVITSVTPNRAYANQARTVTIDGQHLSGVTGAFIAGVYATPVDTGNGTRVVLKVPGISSYGTFNVELNTQLGGATEPQDGPADDFTVVDFGPLGISPSSGPATGGQLVTITDDTLEFASVEIVDFGPNRAEIVERGPGKIVVRTPSGNTPGQTVSIVLSDGVGNTLNGRTDHFLWTATTPPTPTPTPTTVGCPARPTPAPGQGSDQQIIDYGYALSGSATLKTLTKGSLPLAGSIAARLCLPSGSFQGPLVLNPTQGNLTALGFLPVVAKVNLVPTQEVTGSLKSGKLTAVAKVRVKLPSVKTLGIELAGGANCQAKQISSITLTSTQPTFLPLSGGPIAGTFDISDLSGCGFLTGIVSPLTKGSGNAIALQLTPQPTA